MSRRSRDALLRGMERGAAIGAQAVQSALERKAKAEEARKRREWELQMIKEQKEAAAALYKSKLFIEHDFNKETKEKQLLNISKDLQNPKKFQFIDPAFGYIHEYLVKAQRYDAADQFLNSAMSYALMSGRKPQAAKLIRWNSWNRRSAYQKNYGMAGTALWKKE